MKKNKLTILTIGSLAAFVVPTVTSLSSCSEPAWYSDKVLNKLRVVNTSDFVERHPYYECEVSAIESCRYDSFRINFEDDSWKTKDDGKFVTTTPYITLPKEKFIHNTYDTVVYEYTNNSHIDRAKSTKNRFFGANDDSLSANNLNTFWTTNVDSYNNKGFNVKHFAIIDRHTDPLDFGNKSRTWDFENFYWLPMNWATSNGVVTEPEFEFYFESCNFDKMVNTYTGTPRYMDLSRTKAVYVKSTSDFKITRDEFVTKFWINPEYANKVIIL